MAHLLGYGQYEAVCSKDNLLLSDRQSDLEKANSIDMVFVLMSPFWSFLDYEILEDLIDNFGTDIDQQNMAQYVEFLKSFLESCKVEPCIVNHYTCTFDDSRVKLHLKLDTDSMAHYRNIKATIARIFRVKVYAINVHSIKQGCMELIFLFPKMPELPLTYHVHAQLADIYPSVIQLTVGDTSLSVVSYFVPLPILYLCA